MNKLYWVFTERQTRFIMERPPWTQRRAHDLLYRVIAEEVASTKGLSKIYSD